MSSCGWIGKEPPRRAPGGAAPLWNSNAGIDLWQQQHSSTIGRAGRSADTEAERRAAPSARWHTTGSRSSVVLKGVRSMWRREPHGGQPEPLLKGGSSFRRGGGTGALFLAPGSSQHHRIRLDCGGTSRRAADIDVSSRLHDRLTHKHPSGNVRSNTIPWKQQPWKSQSYVRNLFLPHSLVR